MPKLRNIIIFVTIALIIVLIYVFFIRSKEEAPLVSAPATTLPNIDGSSPTVGTGSVSTFAAQDFLTLLLNVKNIKLDDGIFSDPAFLSLRDSTIVLIPDGTEGRPNPFARFGSEGSLGAVPVTAIPAATPANPLPSPSIPKTN